MGRFRQLVPAARRVTQRGNAVLFSLVIMGSALTASLGMATLVTSEISNVALIPPAERAYYKAESFVEQGLWEKKQDPGFEVTDKDELPETFLCSGSCFMTDPKDQEGSLILYNSTTSLKDGEKAVLKQDVPLQLDIDTTTAAGGTGRFDLGSIKPASGLRGVEVTVFAFARTSPFSTIGGAREDTPVLVDTKLFRPGDVSLTMNLGSGQRNVLGESFPPLNSSVYRLRIKALGADTEIEPKATQGLSGNLRLLAPDFRVQSVAEDGPSRRGIEVLVPAVEQAASIFDYVIFSDLSLAKTDAKVQVIKSLRVTARQDENGNCVLDSGDSPLAGLPIAANPGYSASTDAAGIASFSDVQPGTYSVRSTQPGIQACNAHPQSVSFTDDDSTQLKELSFLFKKPALPTITVNGRDYTACETRSHPNYCLPVSFYANGATCLNCVAWLSAPPYGQPPANASYRFTPAPSGTYNLTLSYFAREPGNPPGGYSYRIRIDYPGGSRTVNLPIESDNRSRNLHTYTIPNLPIESANPTLKVNWLNDECSCFHPGDPFYDANFVLNWLRLSDSEGADPTEGQP